MAKKKKKQPEFQEEPQDKIPDADIIKELEESQEKDYYENLSKKNKNFLVKLDFLERERIAEYIIDLYSSELDYHKEICDKIDKNDSIFRMERQQLPGVDSDVPNYRTPVSTVTIEVVHANIMNVIHTPKDIMRVLPTEEGDIPKVKKLGIFGNWSAQNELEIFEKTDRLWHSSEKNGECPYSVYWAKEYGTNIKRVPIMNPADPSRPLIDEDTQQPLYQETEEVKLLYNAPRLEVFSRKDYIFPKNTLMDTTPDWEIRIIRMSHDTYYKEELQNKMYRGSLDEILGWSDSVPTEGEVNKQSFTGDNIPVGKWEKEFITFYGRLKIKSIKDDSILNNSPEDSYDELDDEMIAIVHVKSKTLCQLRKNKFPLKKRPIGVDYFLPDDEGRRAGLGVIDMMAGPQACYDALFNQYVYGVTQANNPFGFFTPMGNKRDEKIKIQSGYLYPTADPASVNIVKIPPPGNEMNLVLELVSYWAQLIFGISDYSAGLESKIDPSAPGKKVDSVIAQGSVRLNLIIKRKIRTLVDIFERWFLLYQVNLPPNKFMRITGSDDDNPWKFQGIDLSDFALTSIPDFEITGNVLNVNKTVEINKAFLIYNSLKADPFFAPQTREGLQAHHSLTKWFMDKLDEQGISRFLPKIPAEIILTPEEENARFIQGDVIKPLPNEDFIKHLKVHNEMMLDPAVPEQIKTGIVVPHIDETIKMMRAVITQQLVMSNLNPLPTQEQGVPNGTGQPAPTAPQGVFPEQPGNMG